MSNGPTSTLPLIDGPVLADALDVSPRAVSMAVGERQACRGYPLYEWIRYGPEGGVRGYDVPVTVRLKLRLPPFEDADSADADDLVDRILRLVTARVMNEVRREVGPLLAELVDDQVGAGDASAGNGDAADQPAEPASGESSDAGPAEMPGDEEPIDNPSSILERARKSLESMSEEESDGDDE